VKKVYDLCNDPRTKRFQDATLYSEEGGIVSEHGLFGSSEWWLAVENGDLPVHSVEGVISDVFMSGHNDYPEFEVDDGTNKSEWTREGDDSEYVIGRPVRVEYVIEKLKSQGSSAKYIKIGLDATRIVVAIWMG
jgi:hypothetical protein